MMRTVAEVIATGGPHRPGTGTSPATTAITSLHDDLPDVVTEKNWSRITAYRAGFDLAAAGYYWEAHEVWEAVWHRTRPGSRAHYLVRALIQLANADLKHATGKHQAADRIALIAAEFLAAANSPRQNPVLMGVDISALEMQAKSRPTPWNTVARGQLAACDMHYNSC